MGDSDDEYDRKRRDKFRGERAEANYRGVDRPVRPRDDWQEREPWSRPRPRSDYRGAPRDRGYSPSIEPQAKRMRHDYYPPHEGYYNHYQSYHQPPHREPIPIAQPEGTQPPMMSFKAFLAAQDDNISDSEAVEKYNEYKLEFQRQQLNEFFVAHKDDEWFRLKYHPEDSVKRREEQLNALKKRVTVFVDLLENGKFEDISVDCTRTEDLIRLLDTVVIKLEGGTEADLAVLDQEFNSVVAVEPDKKLDLLSALAQDKPKQDDDAKTDNSDVQVITDIDKDEDSQPKTEEKDDEVEENGESKEEDVPEKAESEKDNGEPEPIVEKEDEDKVEKMETDEKEEGEEPAKDEEEEVKKVDENGDEPVEPEKVRKRSYSGSESSSSSDSESEKEEPPAEKVDSPKPESIKDDEETEPDEKTETEKEPDVPKPEPPRALHKTTSIFLRNLAPTITRQEVEAMCSRYSGFLRVALADPQPERRWLRRGWVTFTRNANIKEICWNLNNIRLRDCELGAIVNRDLSRRIRQVNGITAHKTVVRSDIRISAKVALHLDGKASLWVDENAETKNDDRASFGLVSNNPVLKNITDYLIEEASAEEDELLGVETSTDQQDTSSSSVDRDELLIKVLDKIILYLRIVHSVDYYNHCEYPNEDEMPNRCGILHARGPPPLTKTDMTAFLGSAVEAKMSHFLPDKSASGSSAGDSKVDKLVTLAMKDEQAELDKFVVANTRELAKDKWLCPLSGKKFKGPDFVRKHIFNKHAEKVEEVKREVQFFNNYLKDPKRPMLAEQQPTKREETPSYGHPGFATGYGPYGGAPPRGGYYNQGYGQRSRGYSRSR